MNKLLFKLKYWIIRVQHKTWVGLNFLFFHCALINNKNTCSTKCVGCINSFVLWHLNSLVFQTTSQVCEEGFNLGKKYLESAYWQIISVYKVSGKFADVGTNLILRGWKYNSVYKAVIFSRIYFHMSNPGYYKSNMIHRINCIIFNIVYVLRIYDW